MVMSMAVDKTKRIKGSKEQEQEESSVIKIWLKEIRIPFLLLGIILVILGSVVAWSINNIFDWYLFILTLFGVLFIHMGANVVNDYFDYKTGTDNINRDLTPFTGGSRVIQDGGLKPKSVYHGAILFALIGIVIGFYLVYLRGWPVLLLGVIGVFCGYFYTEPRINLVSRGVGEIIAGFNFGPIIVLGAYFVQVQRFALEPFMAGLIMGLLGTTILWVNEFPDYNADKRSGKITVVVRLGKRRATYGFMALLILTYSITIFAILFKLLPMISLVVLCTIPIAYKAITTANKYYNDTQKLIPANALTILITILTGILLCISFFVSRIFGYY